jgi:hypothetical protein
MNQREYESEVDIQISYSRCKAFKINHVYFMRSFVFCNIPVHEKELTHILQFYLKNLIKCKMVILKKSKK